MEKPTARSARRLLGKRRTPPGAEEPFPCKLGSSPASNLNYDGRPGDPDWAPYAIILYSAFYDMSDRLIRGFALDPGPAPSGFSFAAVASHKSTAPNLPNVPKLPNWPNMPNRPNQPIQPRFPNMPPKQPIRPQVPNRPR